MTNDMNLDEIILLAFYSAFTVTHLIGEILIYANKEKAGLLIRYITKPFLMPLLAVYYILAAPFICGFMVSGIGFGFIGDILLMISSPEKRKKAFTAGLIMYPISHIFYTIAFIFNVITRASPYTFPVWTLALSIPMVLLGIFAAIMIIPKAEKMKIPMLVNIIILVVMGIASTLMFDFFNLLGAIILVIGVFIYMISVLVYAWHNYVKELPYERLIKMSTYLIGLYLVVQGFIWAFIGIAV